jgi:hypothetical protein
MKVDLLQQLADELIRNDLGKAERVDYDLVQERSYYNLESAGYPTNLRHGGRGSEFEDDDEQQGELKHRDGGGGNRKGNNNAETLLRELANGVAVDELISTKWRVRQDFLGHTEFYGPISGRQQVIEDNEDNKYDSDSEGDLTSIQVERLVELISNSKDFKDLLISNFAQHFATFFYIAELSITEVKSWSFPNRDISKQLLLFAIFTYGAIFTPKHRQLSAFFLKETELLVLKASKDINEYYLQATLIISCYQLGMGLDSNSWTFDAMTSAMTQYLKLDRRNESDASSQSNALFWSVILQDRIITSVLGRGCRIQFFRITTPFFKPVISDTRNDAYLTELTFAHHSKLWFIHDRYLSQIYSFKADHLHNSHKLTLMNQGIESLKKFQDSLPDELKLRDDVEDSRILILHLSYSVVILLLHRAYLKQVPLKVIQIIIENNEISADIILRLISSDNPSIPYFISYLILTCATFDLFLLTNKDESVKASSLKRLKIYISALLKFGHFWKRCLKDIKVLDELAKKWNLNLPFLKKSSTEIAVDNFIKTDDFDGINYNRFFDQFNQNDMSLFDHENEDIGAQNMISPAEI